MPFQPKYKSFSSTHRIRVPSLISEEISEIASEFDRICGTHGIDKMYQILENLGDSLREIWGCVGHIEYLWVLIWIINQMLCGTDRVTIEISEYFVANFWSDYLYETSLVSPLLVLSYEKRRGGRGMISLDFRGISLVQFSNEGEFRGIWRIGGGLFAILLRMIINFYDYLLDFGKKDKGREIRREWNSQKGRLSF